RGTNLRTTSTANLPDLVRAAEKQVQAADQEVASLQKQVSALTSQVGNSDTAVGAAQRREQPLLTPGGLTSVHGPGITVILDDARSSALNAGVDPNQLV